MDFLAAPLAHFVRFFAFYKSAICKESPELNALADYGSQLAVEWETLLACKGKCYMIAAKAAIQNQKVDKKETRICVRFIVNYNCFFGVLN